MNHQEFVEAYKNGTLNAYVPQVTAAEYLSRRLWLPLVRLPLLGGGVALALIGWLITGILVFMIAIVVPILIKRNAVAMVMYQALHDPDVYHDLRESGVLEVYE